MGAPDNEDGRWIPIVTPSELIKRVPNGEIFLTKIDIEGFEADLFDGDAEWIDGAPVVIIELDDWMMPGKGTSRSFQEKVLGGGRELVIRGDNLICINPQLLAK